jgi:hypothetical protein
MIARITKIVRVALQRLPYVLPDIDPSSNFHTDLGCDGVDFETVADLARMVEGLVGSGAA